LGFHDLVTNEIHFTVHFTLHVNQKSAGKSKNRKNQKEYSV